MIILFMSDNMEDWYNDNLEERKNALIDILKTIINTIEYNDWIVDEFHTDVENHYDMSFSSDYLWCPSKMTGRTYKVEIELKAGK